MCAGRASSRRSWIHATCLSIHSVRRLAKSWCCAKCKLESDGAALGVYGRKVPTVCDECAELLVYSEKRRAFCPKEPKPFCSYCDTHCYKDDMREYMREVMRYSGPKSWRHGHAIDGVKHMIEGKKHRTEAERTAAERAGN